MDVATAHGCLDRLGQAWRHRDPAAAADLFTVDAIWDRVAVEWWSVMIQNGRPGTDAGGLFLVFENGRCAELAGYWNLTEGAVPVPEGWGR